jgi:hypothetical protein
MNLSGVLGAAAAATDQRRRYFEKNLEDLDTARRQQIAQFAMSPFTGAMSGMRYGQGAGGMEVDEYGTPAPFDMSRKMRQNKYF